MSKDRISWLDSAKGFGTLLVILGHNLGFIAAQPDWHRAIYSFHMPLFFFLTGCTLNLRIPADVARRAMTTAIPYLVMSLIMMPVSHLFDPTVTYADLTYGILYGTGHTIDLVPLWFLSSTSMALGLIAILSCASQAFKINLDSPHQQLLLGLTLLGIGSIWLGALEIHPHFSYGWGELHRSGLPWNADLAPVAAGYMLLGCASCRRINALAALPKWPLLLLALVLFGLLSLAVFTAPIKFDLNYRKIDLQHLGTLTALIGIAASVALCIACEKLPLTFSLLTLVTQSGIIILWLHGGLQNRGFKIFFSKLIEPNSVLFWIGSFVFATAVPILLDRYIIKKSPLQYIFYPKLRFLVNGVHPKESRDVQKTT